MDKIIYDFGANVGNNLPYYFQKCQRVVAVEANPELCDVIREKYPSEIKSGRLVIVNSAIVDADDEHRLIDFYINKDNPVLSSVMQPNEKEQHLYSIKKVEGITAREIILRHGRAYFCKIDLEGLDDICLRSIFSLDKLPDYISVEAHTVDVFATLIAIGKYKSFKIVDGASVSERYERCEISTLNGSALYSFPRHSAGPFGSDVDGEWMTARGMFFKLASVGLGWKDIHASLNDAASDDTISPFQFEPKVKEAVGVLKASVNRSFRFRFYGKR